MVDTHNKLLTGPKVKEQTIEDAFIKARVLQTIPLTPVWLCDKCDDPRTVAILPRVDLVYYDFGKAKERGGKFWCLLVVQ